MPVFRRAREVVPGIELPEHPIGALREKTVAASASFVRGRRILVYACENCGADSFADDSTAVVTMPCVAMLPPSFIDFALSRSLADGVAVAGCADGDCYYRLGGDWTDGRIKGQRDPYLRRRVDRNRVRFWRTRKPAKGERNRLRSEFATALHDLPKNRPQGRRRNG